MTPRQNLLIDALDGLGRCDNAGDRWACGARLLQDRGSDWLTAGTAARSTGAALAIRSTTPLGLMRDYMAKRLHQHDPWMQICAQGPDPDHLDVVAELATPTRPDKAQLSRLFHDHDLRHAVLLPCYSGPRSGGMVLYTRDRATADQWQTPGGLAETRLLVAVFASLYRPDSDGQAGPGRYSARNLLTPREGEVLCWAFTGLRTGRIAERMGLSEVTVNKHLASVRRKLGAQTREQALAIAIRDGLIQV